MKRLTLAAPAALLLASPALAHENTVELRLPAQSVVDLAAVRAAAEPICPVEVPCAAGTCLAEAFDYGFEAHVRPSREVSVVSPDGVTRYEAHVPEVVIGLEVGFKDPACVADPACEDLLWSEVHRYDLVFEARASGAELCLDLAGLEGEAPPAALAAALRTSFARLCSPIAATETLHLGELGFALAGSAAQLDAAGERLAVRFHFQHPAYATDAGWADFLNGLFAPDSAEPFSLFVHASLLGDTDPGAAAEGCIGADEPICDLLPSGGDVFFEGDARARLMPRPESLLVFREGVSLGGALGLTGPFPTRVTAALETPAPETSGECGAQVQDYAGEVALNGEGMTCDLRVVNDPAGVFVLSRLDRSPFFTDRHAVTLNPDPAVRARYFAAPYPLRVTALTTAGARTFEGSGPVILPLAKEAAAERIVSAIACLLPREPVPPPAGHYHASWLQNAPYSLSVTLTDLRGRTSRVFGGFHGSDLSTEAAPVIGRGGRFTYTDATFTLSGRIYTRLNDGTELDLPVSARFQADGTGTTAADGTKSLVLRPKQTLTFELPAESLPARYTRASVPLTIAPTSVRFIQPAP